MGRTKTSKRDSGNGSTEAAVLRFARSHPQSGQARAANELALLGHEISPSGVRYIWKKHNLETAYKRLKAIETIGEPARMPLTAGQLELLRRGDTHRKLAQKSRYPRTTGKTPTPEDRQDQILRAAAELFARHGYGGTSIRDIAHLVGLLPGSVYHHFPSKEDLFVAIHREGFRQLVSRSEAAIRKLADPWQRLELACAVHIDSAVAGDAIARITAIGLFAIHEDRLQQRLEKDRRSYDQQFRRLVADLALPDPKDNSMFRLALLGALNWTPVWYRSGKLTPKQIAHELIRIFQGRAGRAIQ